MRQQRLHDLGNLIVTTAGLELLSGAEDLDVESFLSSGSDLDLLTGADQLLFGNDQLLFGADADLLFGANGIGDADLAMLSNIVSGSDAADPIDIAGAGFDIIGATTPARRQALAVAMAKRKKAMALKGLLANRKREAAQRRLQGMANIGIQPTLAVNNGYTKARVFPFGFQGDAPTPAGQPGSVTRRPQTPIKIRRLVIPSVIAPSFVITDIKVGKDSQFVGSDPIPGETFAPQSVAVELSGDTANVGHDVTISFANISGAAQLFRAVLIGPAVE
jgi:hypothetical protein